MSDTPSRRPRALLGLTLSCLWLGCGVTGSELEIAERHHALTGVTPVCDVSVKTPCEPGSSRCLAGQTVRIDIEADYLPGVVACENGDAEDAAALEAQAIAARTFTYYKIFVEQKPLRDSEWDQQYSCELMQLCRDQGRRATSASLGAKCRRIADAVRDTAGKVLYHEGHIILGSYLAESGVCPNNENRRGAKCHLDGADPSTCLQPTPYPQANPDSPYNRGCMSQVEANALAAAGATTEEILQRAYGADIRIHALDDIGCPLPAGQPPPLPRLEPVVRWIGDRCTDDSQCTIPKIAWSGFCKKGPDATSGFCSQRCASVDGREPLCPDLKLVHGEPTLGYDRSPGRRWPMTFCAVERNADLGAAQGICVPRCDYHAFPGGGCSSDVSLVCQGKKRPAPSRVWRNACAPPPGKADGEAFPPTAEGDLPNPEHAALDEAAGCTVSDGASRSADASPLLLWLFLPTALRRGRRRRRPRPGRS